MCIGHVKQMSKLSANLQGSVDASLKYGEHQQPGILLGNQAKSFDGLGTSGGNLLGAVSSANEPCQQGFAPCSHRPLLY